MWAWNLNTPLTTIVMSPGGGPLNDNLRYIEGFFSAEGSCIGGQKVNLTSEVDFELFADGQSIFRGSQLPAFALGYAIPVHIDELKIQFNASEVALDKCVIKVTWSPPWLERSNPLPP